MIARSSSSMEPMASAPSAMAGCTPTTRARGSASPRASAIRWNSQRCLPRVRWIDVVSRPLIMRRLYAQFHVSLAGSFANEMAAVRYGPASPSWCTIWGRSYRFTWSPRRTTSFTGPVATTRGGMGRSIARR